MKSPEPEKPKVSRFLHQKSQLVNPKSVFERVEFDLAKTEQKFPEKKVKMVSRATSPSPPSNSVFLRQRRADLEKIVEIEVSRSKKYCSFRSTEMQTDEHPPVPPPPPPTTVRTSSWNNKFSTNSPASPYSPSASPAPSRYSSNTPSRLSSGYSYARPSDLPLRSSSMKPSDFSKDTSPAPRSPRLSSYKSDSPTSPTSSKYSYTRNDSSPVDAKPRLAFSYTPRSGELSPKIPEPPPAPLRTVSIGVTAAKPPQSPRSANSSTSKIVSIDSPEFREAHMLELSNSISKMNLNVDQSSTKVASTQSSSSSEEEEEEEEEEEDSSYSTEEQEEEEEPEELFKAHAYSLIHEFAQASEKPPLPSNKNDPRNIIVRALAPVAGVTLEESSNDEKKKSGTTSPSYHDASEHSGSLHKSKSKLSLAPGKQSDSSSSENARQFLNIPQRDIPKHFTIRKFDSCENNAWAGNTSPRSPSPRHNASDMSWGSSSEQDKQKPNQTNYTMSRMDSNQNLWWNELKPLQNDSKPAQNDPEPNALQGFRIRKMDSTHEPWWSSDDAKQSPQPAGETLNSDVQVWDDQQNQSKEHLYQQYESPMQQSTNDSDRSTAELNQFYMNRTNVSEPDKPGK